MKMNWQGKVATCERNLGDSSREWLARTWGVSVESLRRLRTGFDTYAYTFPVCDAGGRIIGIRTRDKKDVTSKHFARGSTHGLFVPKGVTPANAELACEGESDLAAALTLDVDAIGRPGAQACREMVADFFGQRASPCPCIVADSDSVGIDGAEKLADALVHAGIPCRVLVPPESYGDLREWLVRGELTAEELTQRMDAQETRWPDGWPPGFVMVPNALLRGGIVSEIGAGPVALAHILQSFRGADGKICPDRLELARLMGESVSTVDRYKRVLAGAGLLTWRRGATGRANEYRVDFGPLRKRGQENLKKTFNGS